MPAKSKSQQRFFGMVHALQKGELKPKDATDSVKKTAKSISSDDAEEFASTKHDGLPDKVKEITMEELRSMINEEESSWEMRHKIQAFGGDLDRDLEAFQSLLSMSVKDKSFSDNDKKHIIQTLRLITKISKAAKVLAK